MRRVMFGAEHPAANTIFSRKTFALRPARLVLALKSGDGCPIRRPGEIEADGLLLPTSRVTLVPPVEFQFDVRFIASAMACLKAAIPARRNR
jgi:hypothetical protein